MKTYIKWLTPSAVLAAVPVSAATLAVKDATGTTRNLEENLATSGDMFPSVGLYLGSALISSGNPLPILVTGTPTVNIGTAPTLTVQWSGQTIGVSSLPRHCLLG